MIFYGTKKKSKWEQLGVIFLKTVTFCFFGGSIMHYTIYILNIVVIDEGCSGG